jgi:phosphatidylglycerophosphatase A
MVIVVLFVIGVFSAGAAEKILDRGDPGVVVIDEIVGVLIALSHGADPSGRPRSRDFACSVFSIFSNHSRWDGSIAISTAAWASCSTMSPPVCTALLVLQLGLWLYGILI